MMASLSTGGVVALCVGLWACAVCVVLLFMHGASH